MTSITKNIEDIQFERVELMKKEKENENLEDFENNYTLKVSLLNIDSKYRNYNPKNILDGNPIFLENNPLITTENSYEVKIFYPNHSFKIGDKFILQNVVNEKIILKDKFFLVDNFDYLLINLENHNYNNIVNHNELDNKMFISNFDTLDPNKRLLGNIPINSILGYKEFFTFENIEIENTILNNILNNFNITENELNLNFVFVQLPFEYSKVNKLNNDIVFTDIYTIETIFELKNDSIGGIPLPYLNANYPINNQQYNSCHFVSKIDNTHIYFNSNVKSNSSTSGGLDKIFIAKIINVIEGFTRSDNYIIDLKKSFTDVVRIELVSSEIPFVEFNIKNNITAQNNKLYWKYLDDGDFIYSVTLDEGSYGPDNLLSKLLQQMNKIERLGSTSKNKIFNLFDVVIDKNSQEVQFKSYKLESLPHSLKIIKDNVLSNIYKLQITCANNYVNVGDKITISGAAQIGDILSNIINGEHEVFEINNSNDTFTIIIPVDVTRQNINTSGTGGPYVKVKVPVLASFLFNYQDTIGNLLGFKNVGNQTSVTEFKHITSNFDNYIEEIKFDEVGNKDIYNPLLNLTGSYFYIFLYLNDFEGIISNTLAPNPFAKISLSGYTGDIMFNTFVSSPLEFDVPVSLINELNVQFKYADNTRPNFRNFDHSFTLRITERITKPVRTQVLSKKKDFRQSMIELHDLDRE